VRRNKLAELRQGGGLKGGVGRRLWKALCRYKSPDIL